MSYWKQGGEAPIWFLADPRRTDLALIDPLARADAVRYAWPVAGRLEMSGARPTGTDWYRIAPPGWFAEEGWSMTPETAARGEAAGIIVGCTRTSTPPSTALAIASSLMW